MDEIDRLRDILTTGNVAVLSGAGISTDSGIPDYRGPNGALRARLPMTIKEFTGSEQARRRYWARSQIGWRRMRASAPNANHRAVAALERAGLISGVITQNVDGLHQRAGSRRVIELHGGLDRVICLDCGALSSRDVLDERLIAANPNRAQIDDLVAEAASNPDGDVELAESYVEAFRLVPCECCGSDMLKPHVVFFGENVPRPRVEECFALVADAAALVVLGSSLTVYSGLRFVKAAADDGIPVAIINHGVTRGDPQATLRIDAPLAEVLPALGQSLGEAAPPTDPRPGEAAPPRDPQLGQASPAAVVPAPTGPAPLTR